MLANITRELFPALEMNFFNFKMKKKSGKQFYAFNVFVTTVLWQKFKKISALREFYEIDSWFKSGFKEFALSQETRVRPEKNDFSHLFSLSNYQI